MARVFLDSNVFLYAVGGESPHREPCRRVLTAVGDGKMDAVTSSEVLQEILHVRARRGGLDDAARAVRAAAAMVSEVLPVTGDDVLCATRLLEKHGRLAARDALHVAVMKAARVHAIVSLDKDFDSLQEVRRIDPAAIP